jgi:drug/metabolite transporter (DMT)-like permease
MTAVDTTERRDGIDAFAAGAMVVLTLSWGLNQVLVKVANAGYNPVLLTVGRSAIAAVLVFLWCHWRGIRIFERDGTLPAGILVGVLFGIEFVLMFFGLDYTSAARGTLVFNTMPFWVLLGAHFWLGEKITATKFAGLVLAFAGVALVFSDKGSLGAGGGLKGDLMLLAAGAAWGATIIIIKVSRLNTASAEKTLLYQLVVSSIFSIPLVPLAGPLLREPSILATASLLVQAVYVVSVTYVVWFWLMRRYPASGLSSFTFLSPVFGVVFAVALLGEPFSWRILVAMLLIVAGLIIVNRPARRAAAG